MLTIDRLINGVVLVAPLVIGALLTGVIFVGDDGTSSLPISPFQMCLLLSVVLFMTKRIVEGNLAISLYGLEVLYVLFLSLIFLSIIYTPDREEAFFMVFRFMALLVMTYMIYNSISNYEQLKWISYCIIVIATMIALYNIIQIYANPQIAAFNYVNQGQKLMRSSGDGLDPNVFASNYILPIMLIVAFFKVVKKETHRIILFLAFGIMAGSVLLTYSRSSWLSILTGLLCIFYFTKNYRFIWYSLGAFILAFIFSETLRQLTVSFFERLVDIFSGSSDDSSRYRIILGVTAIYMILDSYLLGIGFRGFSTVFQDYHPPETTQGIFEPHNEFYAVFAELGIIGFILFVSILFLIGKTAYQSVMRAENDTIEKAISIALFATFISYLIFYNFLGGMLFNSILFIVISLIFVNSKLLDSKHFAAKIATDIHKN